MAFPASRTSASIEPYRWLLLAAAVYDGLLGLVFLLFYRPLLAWLAVPAPDNPIYLQLAAGCIALFGLGFYFAWRQPVRNRDLVRIGVGLKALYIGLAAYAALRGLLPHPLFGLLALLDLIFLAALLATRRGLAGLPE